MQNTPVRVVNRETGAVFDEVILGEKWIRWAYQDSSASLVERLLFRSPLISRIMGRWFDSSWSRGKIKSVVEDLSIDMTEALRPISDYSSFNDFFARQLKPESRPYSEAPDAVVSPADGRVLVFPNLDQDVFVPVKGHPMSVSAMLPGLSDRFLGGALAIVRLCPADYHRYHFPTDGQILQTQEIDGALHSVNPIALGAGPDVFGENKRCNTLIQSDAVGTYCFSEVGAFGVGAIQNTKTAGRVKKMEEKGYFTFGGSTVVLIFEPGRIIFSADLVKNSDQGRETLIKVGQPLAQADRSKVQAL